MKKFGIIVVLAMFAIGVSAQEVNHHPYTPKGNTANLNQTGFTQWGFIYQWGDGNTATINQTGDLPSSKDATPAHWMPKHSWGNTAFIEQIGMDNIGTINQSGHGNYALLKQWNWGWYHGTEYADIVAQHKGPKPGAEGTITQGGSHNIVSVLQLSGSKLNITQGGEHNYIGGANGANFCGDLDHYSYEQNCCPRFMFQPLMVGEGQTLEMAQTGMGEYFFGIGVLKGNRIIEQGNDGNWGHDAMMASHHQDVYDYNAIWLEQAGGSAFLTQNGRHNRMWLDIDVLHGDTKGPDVEVHQTGYKNLVAKFSGPCANCASGPAEFNGDKMFVAQNGYKNRLSIESDGWKNVINVTQTGHENFGMIVQKGVTFQHHFPDYCGGCQQ